jgi:homocysteine S-methyltransferase
MVGIIEGMSAEVGPVAAFPNPGLPQLVDGKVRFRRDVDHFAVYGRRLAEAGARLVGGCCGTTPEHVKALAEALRDFRPVAGPGGRGVRARTVEEVGSEEVPGGPSTELAEKLRTGFAVAVEVDLPRGNDIAKVVEASRRLKGRGVDAIDISTGRGRVCVCTRWRRPRSCRTRQASRSWPTSLAATGTSSGSSRTFWGRRRSGSRTSSP